MEWYFIIMLGMGFFYFVTVLLLLGIYYYQPLIFWWRYRQHRDKLTRCVFLMPNGTLVDDCYLVHDDDKMVNYDGGSYHVIPELGYYSTKRNILTMVYTYGVSAPINFNHMDKKNIPDYDSGGLQKALQEKFIKDLLTEQNRMLLLMILVIVTLVLVALDCLKDFGIIDKLLKQGNG